MWKIGARHCLYHHEGGFYENLQRFPGALCDPKGYVRFETESEYQNSSYLNIGAKTTLNNRVDGIAGMPGYVRVTENTIE
jgi:5-methylcytosine-specific restriction protein A